MVISGREHVSYPLPRDRGAIFILSKTYEIASIITFTRKDIMTQSKAGAIMLIASNYNI